MSRTSFSRRSFLCAMAGASLFGVGALAGCSAEKPAEEKQGAPRQEASPAAGNAATDEPKLVEAGKLIVGSDCDYPPFTMLDGKHAAGFEYDLLCAICDEIGLECEYHSPLKFDTLCATVAAGGTVDVAVSATTINDERAETVDFTDAYFDSNQSVIVLKDSGLEVTDDLTGKNIAVQSGTTGESWAKENIADAAVTSFDEAPAALAALQAGKAEGVVIDLPVAVELLNTSYDTCTIIDEVPTGEQYGIAVSKDNSALTKLLNEGLAKIRANGSYQKVHDKYFALAG